MTTGDIRLWKTRWVTVVDRPELRDDSYPKVGPGARIKDERAFTNQGAALRFAKGLAEGMDDTGSEYIDKIEVRQVYNFRGPRWVLKPVCRERRGAKVERVDCDKVGLGGRRRCKTRKCRR